MNELKISIKNLKKNKAIYLIFIQTTIHTIVFYI